eukprot:7380477-Prymnesium_polylepis.4
MLFGTRRRPGLSGGFLVLRNRRRSASTPQASACECIWWRRTQRGMGRGAPFVQSQSKVEAVMAVSSSSVARGEMFAVRCETFEANVAMRAKAGSHAPA